MHRRRYRNFMRSSMWRFIDKSNKSESTGSLNEGRNNKAKNIREADGIKTEMEL